MTDATGSPLSRKSSVFPLPISKVGACVNCGAQRNDLIEHEGHPWCPNYGDCDRKLHYEALGRDLEEAGQR